MLNGKMEHKDSMGNQGVIGPGGVQWMTAVSCSGFCCYWLCRRLNRLVGAVGQHGQPFWGSLAMHVAS